MVSNALRNCETGSRKKGRGPLPEVQSVPWIVLGQDFVIPGQTFSLIRHLYSWWMSDYSYRNRTQSGQCTLNLDMAFCLALVLSQI